MAKNGYIITHSNYTEKKKHKQLSNSDIYERDYMTTTNLGGWDSGSIPYGEGNFKIITKDNDSTKRKHKYGNWLLNENCTASTEDNCEFFTMENLPESEKDVTVETEIVKKPSKNSLLDYAYYGNCEELINTSIKNIVANYPGELYVTDQPFEYLDANGNVKVLGRDAYYQEGDDDLVVIDNPFDIDIVSQTNTEDRKPLYCFCDSANKYVVIEIDGTSKTFQWNVKDITDKKNCFRDGEKLATIELDLGSGFVFIIYQYYLAGNKFLLTNPSNAGRRIRPNSETVENEFNNFDSFEKFLLNRDSKPLYKIDIDTPNETDLGVFVSRRSYVWPTTNDWNLDCTSDTFRRYYDGLSEIAKWYDQNNTDNLWRNMVHEAIKNMDHTITDVARDEDGNDYRIGMNNIHGLMLAYGRQFDEIKHDIDNIKTVNSVTYNENNNTPDYFLTDQVNLSGWEVKSVVETLDKNTTVEGLFPGNDKEYSLTDTNLIFLRNIKLNSRDIFARKGTKQAVEMTLSLFGYKSYDWAKKYYEALSNNKKPKRGRRPLNFDELPATNEYGHYDYKLDEYVVTVKNTSSDVVPIAEELPVEKYNSYKLDYNGQESTVEGLPVRLMEVFSDDSTYKYIIPWFDKEDTLDGNPYFQMYGGWEKEYKKKVVPNKELYPNVNEIYTISGFTVFNETKKYLKVTDNIENLINVDPNKINENDIFYVNDISDIGDYSKQYNNTNFEIDSLYGKILLVNGDATNIIKIGDSIYVENDGGKKIKYTVDNVNYNPVNGKTTIECVEDIDITTSLGEYIYKFEPTDVSGATNYFIIKKVPNCYFCGVDENTGEVGWENISKETLSCVGGPTPDAYRVIYLENIIEDSKGNNPHVGYGKYDNGETYVNYFRQLFKGAIENNLFGDDAYDCETGEILDEIKNLGFETETSIDNVKVWYFTDSTNTNKIYQLKSKEVEAHSIDPEDLNEYTIPNGYEINEDADTTVNVGYNAYSNHEVGFTCEMNAFNMENQENGSNDEAAANSIINVKKLVLTFSDELSESEEFYDYFNKCVLPYVEQTVPSTTVFEIEFNKNINA